MKRRNFISSLAALFGSIPLLKAKEQPIDLGSVTIDHSTKSINFAFNEDRCPMYDRQMQVFCEICEGERAYGYPGLTDGQSVQRILDAARSGDHTGPHGVNKATR